MTNRSIIPSVFLIFFLTVCNVFGVEAQNKNDISQIHTWKMIEIVLEAEKEYDNYYTDVTCWVDLEGPDFSKRIYGFWNGENNFIVRIVATKAGLWTWKSGSNIPDDNGLNNNSGLFKAINWTEKEKEQNPNRRGFVKATENGHALQYDDGTPFFMVGDTWLAGSTWRLPYRNATTSEDYIPGPGIGFEDAVIYRSNQGYNSVSMIAAFPNWDSDNKPSTFADSSGVFLRNAWEKFGYDVSESNGIDASGGLSYWGTLTAKNMRDEYGNLPFEMSNEHKGVSNFNRINPEYFKSLDKKMTYLNDQGFVALLETVRRDVGPSWKAYYNFNESFARYVQYLMSRYGAYNFIFSGIHLDWIPKDFSLTADEFNEALTYHLETYGPMPFGQIHTTLIDRSTYKAFGHDEDCPWLTMHSVGNKPRDHRVTTAIDTLFNLSPPYPAINFEPYYTGWNHSINKPNGERPPANSERDNYFARAQMYGSVFSGALSGHVHGTASYDITTTGEPEGARPHFWEALKYDSGHYMQHLNTFIGSEGKQYQYLEPVQNDIIPNKAQNSPEAGLDGWSYMMRTPNKDFALLYFENESVLPELTNFNPNTFYTLTWFNPISGQWKNPVSIKTNKKGVLVLPEFPNKQNPTKTDWALKITQ
ncbi:DUF4038 domain-containing protein [Flaviramulus sp. BrNp1-15]|uniref:DUF5060 domain-containing protein n=1 Tax=Flaviramulus sp. BrNp1-15 TaxID=2916754 RepID=UPI001EE8DE13|nr:DUF5060 domain-containing protein [Flaviramulus sp. BrNp1-15]ULC58189.1 DUF4038 domain-containing protein [Flaviramulus sp. BrNp1-15]